MKYTESFDHADAIAIIGMAGRFPGARNLDEFWKNLKAGVESISFFGRIVRAVFDVEAPEWVLTVGYVLFGSAVVAAL